MSLALGQCFFTPETDTVSRHLWIIVSHPQRRPERVVFVNVSTTPGPENPPPAHCIVAPNEHPSVSRPSIIRCDGVRQATADQLNRLLATQTLSGTQPASADLVRKAQRALGASPHTPNEVKDILRAQGYI